MRLGQMTPASSVSGAQNLPLKFQGLNVFLNYDVSKETLEPEHMTVDACLTPAIPVGKVQVREAYETA